LGKASLDFTGAIPPCSKSIMEPQDDVEDEFDPEDEFNPEKADGRSGANWDPEFATDLRSC